MALFYSAWENTRHYRRGDIFNAIRKHDLLHELPEYKDKIHQLKVGDRHFSKLFTEYHDLDHEIHRFETGVENCDDAHLEERKNCG
jgi:Uncharacterized protein conserved in bacteria